MNCSARWSTVFLALPNFESLTFLRNALIRETILALDLYSYSFDTSTPQVSCLSHILRLIDFADKVPPISTGLSCSVDHCCNVHGCVFNFQVPNFKEILSNSVLPNKASNSSPEC